jgi:hypothetical protein
MVIPKNRIYKNSLCLYEAKEKILNAEATNI